MKMNSSSGVENEEHGTDDLAAKVTSNSQRNEATALNHHFKRFVITRDALEKVLVGIHGNIESIQLQHVSCVQSRQNLISHFSSYLIKVPKCQSAKQRLVEHCNMCQK